MKDDMRVPMGEGIAGYVGRTGETLNIADAWNDDRFSSTQDLRTGYTDIYFCQHSVIISGLNCDFLMTKDKPSLAIDSIKKP